LNPSQQLMSMNNNGTSQTQSKNASSIVQPPPTPNVHGVVPPPPPPSGVAVPPPSGQRILFQPQTIGNAKTGTTTLTSVPFNNTLRSPIKQTTFSGNITLNTNSNVSKVIPKTPPRQHVTSFTPPLMFPFTPQVGAINLQTSTINRGKGAPPTHITLGTANIPNQIHPISPNVTPTQDDEANKKRKLNGGEPSRISSSLNVINLEDENSNNSDANTPSTPQQDDTLNNPGSAKKRKRYEFSNGGTTGGRGCSCRKTGCLKRYCECFQNSRRCTVSCHCAGCKNYEGSGELSQVLDKPNSGAKKGKTNQQQPTTQVLMSPRTKYKPTTSSSTPPPLPPGSSTPNRAQPNYYSNIAQMPLVGFTNLFDVVAGPDAIVELCKRLLLTTYRQEQLYTQHWHNEQRLKQIQQSAKVSEIKMVSQLLSPVSSNIISPPQPVPPSKDGDKTPPPKTNNSPPKTPPSNIVSRQSIENSSQPSPDTLSLLCDEDDALHGAAASSSQEDQKMNSKTLLQHVASSSHKGFEHALQVSLENAVLEEFSHFLRDKLNQYYGLEQQQNQQFSFSSPVSNKRR
jgi:hypothetical protein